MSRPSTRRASAEPVFGMAPWVRRSSLVLSLIGLALSAYLTFEHFSAARTLACPDTGAVNCVKVTTSAYAKLFGVPVALLGLLFFSAVTALCLPPAWRSAGPWIGWLRLAAVTSGVAFVLYLVWAEMFRVDAICLWCTVVHVTAVALFAVVVLGAALYPDDSV